MRILICKDYLSIGGMTTYIMHLADALKINNEIHLICTHFKGNYFDQVKTRFQSTFVLNKDLNFLNRFFEVYKKIKSINPDIIFLNHSPLINMLLPFLPSRIRVISVIHSDDSKYYFQGSFYSPWIDLFICPAPKLKEVLKNDYKIPEAKISIIPHGVAVEVEENKKIKNSIVFIGNLDLHKGCDILIPVFNEVYKSIPSSTLTIIGDGPKNGLLKEQLEFLPYLKKKVKLIPNVSNQDVYRLLSKMEVLFFPTKLESFGFVIPEAMINGVIPVVSNLRGITDQFIIDGENGFLCDSDDLESFSKNIINVLLSKDKFLLSANAKIRVQNNFTLNLFSKRYIDIIKTLKKSNDISFFNTLFFYIIHTLMVLIFKFNSK